MLPVFALLETVSGFTDCLEPAQYRHSQYFLLGEGAEYIFFGCIDYLKGSYMGTIDGKYTYSVHLVGHIRDFANERKVKFSKS